MLTEGYSRQFQRKNPVWW